MRGPSSSHCAAAVRIGRMARDLMDGQIEEVLVEFDPNGSLATTHQSQGSDMGLFGGLMGWDAVDARLPDAPRSIQEAGIKVDIRLSEFGADHPNTYKLTLKNSRETHAMVAVSTGGGIIEVTSVDGLPISMAGDFYETLLFFKSDEKVLLDYLRENTTADEIVSLNGVSSYSGTHIIEIKTGRLLTQEFFSELETKFDIRSVKLISPVLPVLSLADVEVPFRDCASMLTYNRVKNLDLWELAVHYESVRGSMTSEEVVKRMEEIVGIMQRSIHDGVAGTEYADRILGHQSGNFHSRMEADRLLDGGMLNHMILYTTAIMEVKSAMGVIVAAPTAGACGCLPGAVIGAASSMGLSMDEMTRAMLAAGLIGAFIAAQATFAAEAAGCQAETGAGSSMAAAALVTLAGGTTEQAVSAASMALQNTLGLICDPVANRVEVPCLGRNVMAAGNALACANMALADYDAVIPLDEVIVTMYKVGRSLPSELRCTALGGLSITKTSKEIEQRLAAVQSEVSRNLSN